MPAFLRAACVALALTTPLFAQSRRVAIYKDTGVWFVEGSRAIPAVLEWLGHTWTWVDAGQIEKGILHKNGKPAFDLLLVPGGWAGDGSATVASTLWLGKTWSLPLEQAGSANAYYALAASTDVVPGLSLAPGLVVPLKADYPFSISLNTPTVFRGFLGKLDSQGRATPSLSVPLMNELEGLSLYFAFATVDGNGWRACSAPAMATIR